MSDEERGESAGAEFVNSRVDTILRLVPIPRFEERDRDSHRIRVLQVGERCKVLDELGVERYCCRAMFLGQADLIEEVSKFKKRPMVILTTGPKFLLLLPAVLYFLRMISDLASSTG
jgi:DNA-directed RNA polymerase subunit N (RpoN/RPB10)